jgi:micrococcal nuclease
MIRDGFAYEYTYNLPYKYQAEFKLAQKNAQAEKAGLWGELCNGERVILQSKNSAVQTTNENGECNIKGNISSTGEKIYHTQNCPYYSKTIISESQGEKWFCSESEAVTAGWRKAQNCN